MMMVLYGGFRYSLQINAEIFLICAKHLGHKSATDKLAILRKSAIRHENFNGILLFVHLVLDFTRQKRGNYPFKMTENAVAKLKDSLY